MIYLFQQNNCFTSNNNNKTIKATEHMINKFLSINIPLV